MPIPRSPGAVDKALSRTHRLPAIVSHLQFQHHAVFNLPTSASRSLRMSLFFRLPTVGLQFPFELSK